MPGFAIILSATLASAGLPLEAVALVAGLFRVIESGTTTLNVLGNAITPLVISRWEGVQVEAAEPGPVMGRAESPAPTQRSLGHSGKAPSLVICQGLRQGRYH